MKSFKSFIQENLKKELKSGTSYVIRHPIHFKHIQHEKDDDVYVIKHPIHFKHIQHEKEKIDEGIFSGLREVNLADPNSHFSQKYVHVNDNTHLGGPAVFHSDGFSRENSAHLNEQSKRIISTQKPFTREHIKAVKHYTTDEGSRIINYNLLGQAYGWKTKKLPVKHQTTMKNLDDVIKKNPVKVAHSVYSGIPEELGRQFKKSKKVKSPAYISASLHKHIARDFATKDMESAYFKNEKIPEQHYLHIHLKPGDPATHISHHSDIVGKSGPSEYETLIRRGVTLRHIKTQRFRGTEGSPVYVHHVEIER